MDSPLPVEEGLGLRAACSFNTELGAVVHCARHQATTVHCALCTVHCARQTVRHQERREKLPSRKEKASEGKLDAALCCRKGNSPAQLCKKRFVEESHPVMDLSGSQKF